MALGLAILGGSTAALLLTLGASTATAIVPPNYVARIDPAGTRIESYQSVGRDPVAIAVGLAGVWVANAEDGTVTRLDPAAGERVDTIGAGGGDLNDIAVGFGSVWVANGNDGTITKIDPHLDQAEPAIQLGRPTLAPDPVFYIAVDSHYVWATRGTQLLRIDPGTGSVERHVSVGTPTGLATGGGSVWVTTQSGSLLRIDPHNPKPPDTQPLPSEAFSPVYGDRSLLLIAYAEIHQIQPTPLARACSACARAYGPSHSRGEVAAFGRRALAANSRDWTSVVNPASTYMSARTSRPSPPEGAPSGSASAHRTERRRHGDCSLPDLGFETNQLTPEGQGHLPADLSETYEVVPHVPAQVATGA